MTDNRFERDETATYKKLDPPPCAEIPPINNHNIVKIADDLQPPLLDEHRGNQGQNQIGQT